jgi:4-hydroxybenzoate polyprenyltransferase
MIPAATTVGSAFDLVFRRLRLSEPWRYKAPFLISVPYFLLHAAAASLGESLVAIFWALCTVVGIAGFGYFSNDVVDRRADSNASRPNGTATLSPLRTALVFGCFLAAALVPWLVYFPADRASLGLLAAEFLLLLAYAAPPLRLKERGLSGLVADSLYAHVIPAALAGYTFHLLTGRVYGDFPLFVATLACWQFVLGLRNVLTHQLTDVENDRAAGTTTYVTRRGERAADRLLRHVLVPLELLAWTAFLLVVTPTMPVLAAAWPVYLAVQGLNIARRPGERLFEPSYPRLDLFLNEYYLRWMPLVILLVMAASDSGMIVLFLLHLALFRNGITPWLLARGRRLRHAEGDLA